MLYIITMILWVITIGFVFKDTRSIVNPVMMALAGIFTLLSISHIAVEREWNSFSAIWIIVLLFCSVVLIFIGAIFLIYNGIVMIKREGYSKANLLPLVLGSGVVFIYAELFVIQYFDFMIYNHKIIYSIHLIIIYTYFLFLVSFFGLMIYCIFYNFIPKNKKYDFIVIHGAGLLDGQYVTPLLKGRADKAIQIYKRNKNDKIKIISSGGQGLDEKISEAKAIKNYLLSQGIDEADILLEEKSRTTYENLKYSKEIGEKLIENPRFVFVTNDYHVFRTSTYAKKIGMQGDGVGCKTAGYFIPSGFIREYIAIVVKLKYLFVGLYVPFFLLLFMSLR